MVEHIAHFFKDTNGNIVVWQWPNVPLLGWFLFKLLSLALDKGAIRTGCERLSLAFLFTWAYLEITKGVSPFRKALGLIVSLALIYGFFK